MALTRRSVVCSAVCLALLVGLAYAGHDHEHVEAVTGVNIDNMSLEELDTQLQVRPESSPLKGSFVLTSIPTEMLHCRTTQRFQARPSCRRS